ncbi:MAG: hypothetical protein CL927_09190 [Deltaproteobacteria bacterium]|nr:hypothetical protein [Deltaproteobacteria bacterium]
MRASLVLIGLTVPAGCAPKPVPEHLRVAPSPTAVVDIHRPQSLTAAIGQLVDIDPLVRRPDPRSTEWWKVASDTEPIQAWLSAQSPLGIRPAALDALEVAWPGTVAVPLARGGRLAKLETTLPTAPPSEAGDRSLVVWMGSLTVSPTPGPSDVRPPLDWLAPERGPARQGLVHIAERSVMLGWLSGPNIPLQPVADAMVEGRYDRLRDRPEGTLILQRAAGSSHPEKRQEALDALQLATTLAWTRAAADGVVEQQKAQALARSIAREIAHPSDSDPLPSLLSRAREGFSADASSPASTGLALVTIAAERLVGTCPDAPCADLGRIATLRQAEVWDPEVIPYARLWRLIAAKDALDQVTASVENKRPIYALPLIADLMVGENGERVPLSLLLQRSLSPEAVLTITRGLDAPDGTQPAEAVAALEQHIETLCTRMPTAQPSGGPVPLSAICPVVP